MPIDPFLPHWLMRFAAGIGMLSLSVADACMAKDGLKACLFPVLLLSAFPLTHFICLLGQSDSPVPVKWSWWKSPGPKPFSMGMWPQQNWPAFGASLLMLAAADFGNGDLPRGKANSSRRWHSGQQIGRPTLLEVNKMGGTRQQLEAGMMFCQDF